MIVRAQHYNPIDDFGGERTYLKEAVAAAATSSKVQSNQKFANNDFVLLGEIGMEQSEIIKLSGVSGNDTLSHSTVTPKYPHNTQTPATQMKYDQVEFHRSATKEGTYSLVTTVEVDVDQPETIYDDTAGTATSWGKIRFKNSHTTTYSDYSPPFPYAGYSEYSAFVLINEVIDEFAINDPTNRFVKREKVRGYLQRGVHKVANKLVQEQVVKHYESDFGTMNLAASADQDVLTQFSTLRSIITAIKIKYSSGGVFVDATQRFTIPKEGDVFHESYPEWMWQGGKIRIFPTPSGAVTNGLWVFGVRIPNPMDDEADEPDVPRGMASILKPYALARLHGKKEKPTRYAEQMDEFEEELEDAVNTYKSTYATPRYVRYIDDNAVYDR